MGNKVAVVPLAISEPDWTSDDAYYQGRKFIAYMTQLRRKEVLERLVSFSMALSALRGARRGCECLDLSIDVASSNGPKASVRFISA